MSRFEPAEEGTFTQSIDLRAFLLVSLKHGVLNLLTLTLHRFWGQAQVRRWIWGAVDIEDEPLDYVGGGLELLLGFLLRVVVIGGPVLIAWFAVKAWGVWGAPLVLTAWALAAFFQGMGRFAGFLYMASHTEWRGQNFQLEGSPVPFALRHLRDAGLCVITLGWWQPRAHLRQARRLWGALNFHGRPFYFDTAAARRTRAHPAYAIGWFGTVMIVLFAAGILLGLAAGFFPTPDVGSAPTLSQLAALFALTVGLWVLLNVIWAPYQAERRRGVALGLGLSLDIDWREMARLNAMNALLRFASLGVLAPFVQARTSAFLVDRLKGRMI